MRKKLRAVTLIELVVLAGVVTTVLSLSFVNLARLRELSKRLVCSVNLKGIGAVTQIYAQDNDDQWMVPPFRMSAIDRWGIDYVKNDETFIFPPRDEGEVGWNRLWESTSETPSFPSKGSTQVSVTRAFWMLVRSRDVHVKQFVCPSNYDTPDESEALSLYYDFTGYTNISYGYQVPFGPRATRPHVGADPGRIQAADKGPFYLRTYYPDWTLPDRSPIDLEDPAMAWRPFNSPNHGGLGNGEGQNCLFPDASVCFHSIPAVGVDNDNIYTVMTEEWGTLQGFNRIHGDTVHTSPITYPYPGQNVFGQGPNMFASTDTLIYP
ncbi:MAG: hypothetical protein JSU86_13020 [Phycisphaerales bacterium]|nr:MAG: hypothetical protein JSU86_13020 [Phycisphaerales bacterium]